MATTSCYVTTLATSQVHISAYVLPFVQLLTSFVALYALHVTAAVVVVVPNVATNTRRSLRSTVHVRTVGTDK